MLLFQKLLFAISHYLPLLLFAWAAWGVGDGVLARLRAPARRDALLDAALATALGVGLFICAFQLLAIAGMLTRPAVLACVGGAALAAAWRTPVRWREARRAPSAGPPTPGERWALAALALAALPTLAEPLAPPAAFDEMMYHLPWAREVAASGRLGIHDWLRYPWFPYNYNLLYAGALLVWDDVFAHLLNALAGWIAAALVYALGRAYADRIVACIGAAIWLGLGDYTNALIDMGVALFVLAGCAALWRWHEMDAPRPRAWLALAALFFGLAAGAKYQALVFLPLAALFAIRRERRLSAWLAVLAAFLLPCVYWYARNAVQTGDPFNPIGARVFGFSNWNAGDYERQLYDVRDHARAPSVLLWPVLLLPFTPRWRAREGAVRAGLVFCAYALAVWLLTSRYPRYMTSSVPLMALGAALGWQWLAQRAGAALRARRPGWVHGRGVRPAALVAGVVAIGVSLQHTARFVGDIAPTAATREAFLNRHVPGYEVLSRLRADPPPGKLYQVGLSDAIYYAPNPVYGDVFGPYRYADFLYLPPAEMARKLAARGFGALVIQTAIAPYFVTQPQFDRHFALLHERGSVKAYRIVPAP